MNFPTEVVTPKEIAHYLLFTRWHHFWGQIRTWDKSEKNQAEAELADALESYAESFRAETLTEFARHVPEPYVKIGSSLLPGDCEALVRCSCGWDEDGLHRDGGKCCALWQEHILALSPDPNWLARQIAAADSKALEVCKSLVEWDEYHDGMYSWNNPNIRRFVDGARAALSATKLESGEPQQQPEVNP